MRKLLPADLKPEALLRISNPLWGLCSPCQHKADQLAQTSTDPAGVPLGAADISGYFCSPFTRTGCRLPPPLVLAFLEKASLG